MRLKPPSLTEELSEWACWLIKLRWIGSAGTAVGAMGGRLILGPGFPYKWLILAGASIALYNFILKLLTPRIRSQGEGACKRFIAAQVGADWLALGAVASLSGGMRSPAFYIFPIHILISSALLSPLSCYLVATGAFLVAASISTLELLKLIPIGGLWEPLGPRHAAPFLSLLGAGLYLTAFLSSSIIQLVKDRERRLMALQEELRRSYDELERSMMMRSQFILAVTHELRAPLSTVQSLLRVVLDGYTGEVPDKAKELIGRAERRVRFLLELVGDLLDLAVRRIEGVKSRRVDVDLRRVAEEVAEGYRAEAEAKGLTFEAALPDRPLILEGDEGDLQKLLSNLLSNAVKYTPPGGRVTLKVEEGEREVIIEVADTGIGIPKEDMPKLFKEFFRAENARKMAEHGTGLGLAIVKRIVDEHGGTISVESELGKGTRFLIRLPHRAYEGGSK